jgi:VWFA-related protein
MELDVVVSDKDGHPVLGLKQSDFSLLDNDRPTAIASFSATGVATGHTEPTLIILVVDEINTTFDTVSTERPQLHNFLMQNQGKLPFPVTMLFVTNTGIHQVNQPSTDGNVVDAALRKQQGTVSEIPRSAGFGGRIDRMQISLQAFTFVTQTLAPLPGRKLLIWISRGWSMFHDPNIYLDDQQRQRFFSTIVNLAGTLCKGRITLYSIDPTGTPNAAQEDKFEREYYLDWQNFLKPERDSRHVAPGDLGVEVLATQSGGRVFFGNNDIAGEIEKSIDDGSFTYRITFEPQHGYPSHTWHDLAVEVDKPGVKVRTRNGYYAEP